MTHYFTVPGLGNSDPEHWQSYFEKSATNCRRIEQADWETPNCADWIKNIDEKVIAVDLSTVVLVGHSLGCTAIAHWAAKYRRPIKAAMLVAPSDLEAPMYTFPTIGFTPIPLEQLPFKSLVVASSDDVWVSLERARFFADKWGSDFINMGKAGHINVASGHTNWEEGFSILQSLG